MYCSTTLLLFWKHRSDRHLSITLSPIVEITIYEQQKNTRPRNTTDSESDPRICIPAEICVQCTHLGCCSVIRFSINWNKDHHGPLFSGNKVHICMKSCVRIATVDRLLWGTQTIENPTNHQSKDMNHSLVQLKICECLFIFRLNLKAKKMKWSHKIIILCHLIWDVLTF